jgi:cellulose synthase/poly-beta-1,6-N-acetylglucosamine synthase-like glycosyltransferase
LFCPCKGLEPDFEENIRSLLTQDYPRYRAHFVVESEDDPACGALRQRGLDVLVAGRAANRGQKVHNLAYAVARRPQADIYVFCDSDARFPPGWLSSLVAPLGEANICTGYRWYVPGRFHFPTLMRSAWNASTAGVLGDHGRNFAWGGSTAMYRGTFERLDVPAAWQGSVSDDYSITRAARRSGTRITFVPECLAPSYGECTFRELLEFTTRQVIISRVYDPALWRIGFAGHLMFSIAFWTLPFFAPALWFTAFAMSAAKSGIRYSAAKTVLPEAALSKHGWFYILSSPLVPLLFVYNMAVSAFRTEISWRSIHYKLLSPSETRVSGGSADGEN